MYFKTYSPAARDCSTARAVHTYNAVKNFCKKETPRFTDYFGYLFDNRLRTRKAAYELGADLLARVRNLELTSDEAYQLFVERCQTEWAAIKEAVSNLGQPLANQYVVYFMISCDGQVKCGKTKNIVQRHVALNLDNGVVKMWYLPCNSNAEALAAEHALHRVFDKARCMNRAQGRSDYYECKPKAAETFIKNNAKKMYTAIMEAIEGVGE